MVNDTRMSSRYYMALYPGGSRNGFHGSDAEKVMLAEALDKQRELARRLSNARVYDTKEATPQCLKHTRG